VLLVEYSSDAARDLEDPMASRSVFVIASIVIACLCGSASVKTQTQSQDVTTALLTEVRALRTTIALVARAGASGQLALGRLQLQEQRVNVLIGRLDKTREDLAVSQREVLEQRENCKSVESALTTSTVGAFHAEYQPSREAVEQMVTRCRTEVAAVTAETQRLAAEETVLAGDLSTEQARWSELNQRLEEIEMVLRRSQ
jgi:chromosome segregation ATPase